MKKLFKRLIVFFIGVPALLSIIVFFPWNNHLLLNLLIIVFSVLGAVEFRTILGCKGLVISLPEAIIFGAVSPAAWTLVVCLGVSGHIVPGAFILGASWLLISRIFTNSEKLDSYIGRAAAGFALMIYPGLFMAWIVQMSVIRESDFESSMIILIFFLVVFLADACAWVAGMLFGKNNRNIFAASPNKSIAGFFGGLFASVLIGIIAVHLIPEVFTSTLMPSLPAGALLGFCAGIAATLGDLGESALKRSAGMKDSGSLIMGRGGALDSIDSLILAAPVYYILFRLLF